MSTRALSRSDSFYGNGAAGVRAAEEQQEQGTPAAYSACYKNRTE